MDIQDSMNRALSSAALGFGAKKYFNEKEELKKSIDSIPEKLYKNQAEVEANMKPINDAPLKEETKEALGPDAKFVAEGTPEAEAMKKFDTEFNKNIKRQSDAFDIYGNQTTTEQLDKWINASMDSELQADINEVMAERAIDSSRSATDSYTTTRGNFEAIRDAAKNNKKVRPYVIIKGSTTKKKYL